MRRQRKQVRAMQDNGSERSPLFQMWFQVRAAVADLSIPLLAGLKTMWLLLLRPRVYFQAYCLHNRPVDSLQSPLDPLWLAISGERERPALGPAQFLFFGIFAAILAGFEFDNSNQLVGLLQQTGISAAFWVSMTRLSPTLADVIGAGQAFFANPIVVGLESFFDQTLLSAVVELFSNLISVVLFSYIFRLLVGRKLASAHSYAFWLYMLGLQFVTTAVSSIVFSLVSLDLLGLPEVAPDVFFYGLETGLHILWHYLFPMLVLPRVFEGLTGWRVLGAALITRAVLLTLNWLLATGLILFSVIVGLLLS